MKTKIGWFLIGFVSSWLAWSALRYILERPRDYMQHWNGPLRGAALRDPALGWLSNAYGRRMGDYRIFTAAEASNASAQLQGPQADGFPGVNLQDENADGRVESIFVVDSAHRHFLFRDTSGNGAFDSCEYTTGIGPDWKTFRDDDMDGQYDFCSGSGGRMAVFIDSQWRDVVSKDNKHYVELHGKLTRVELLPVVKVVDDDREKAAN